MSSVESMACPSIAEVFTAPRNVDPGSTSFPHSHRPLQDFVVAIGFANYRVFLAALGASLVGGRFTTAVKRLFGFGPARIKARVADRFPTGKFRSGYDRIDFLSRCRR
jgi:hypothetical protein